MIVVAIVIVAEALKQHMAFILFRKWSIICFDDTVEISTPGSMKSLIGAVNTIQITNHSDPVHDTCSFDSLWRKESPGHE